MPIFNELKFGVLGFTSEEMVQIKLTIEKKEGKIISNINEIIACEDLNIILLKNSETKTYESFLNTLKIPVINENWFGICSQRNFFIKPEYFSLGHKAISNQIAIQREIFHNEMKILSDNKLRKCLKEIDSCDSSYWFLSDCMFHFLNIERNYEKLLKDIVNISGGFYLNQFNTTITHLIAENCSEEELNNFKKTGSNFYVLHPLWLKDCFLYKKKVSEFEYFLMPGVNLHNINTEMNNNPTRITNFFKKQQSYEENFSFMERKTQMKENQIKENQMKEIKDAQENKLPKNSNKNMLLTPFKKDQYEVKSFLFMNLHFFINTSDFKELRSYRLKILEHSGKIIDNLKNNKRPIFYVLSDGKSSLIIKGEKLENVNYVSYRWIDYCLEKKQIVKNHMELRLIHLSPLTFKMPMGCFKGKVMYVCGFATQEKIILKSLMIVMGITLSFDK